MKALRPDVAALCALAGCASAGALAQVVAPVIPGPGHGSLFPTPIPPQTGMPGARDGRHHRSGNVFILTDEPEVVHDVVVVHDEAAAPPPPAAPAPPHEPYVIGRTYRSLPGHCLKLVQGGGSFFHCSEGWYRQVGSLYRAVPAP